MWGPRLYLTCLYKVAKQCFPLPALQVDSGWWVTTSEHVTVHPGCIQTSQWAGEMLCVIPTCSELLKRNPSFGEESLWLWQTLVAQLRGRRPGAMDVWCKYFSALFCSQPAACTFWCISHSPGAWEKVALKQTDYFINIPENEKNHSFVQVLIKYVLSPWKSCFSYSGYPECEIKEQFLVLVLFPPLASHRVIVMLSSTSCVKLQIFLLHRSLTTSPTPAAVLAF